ncbi:Probable multidrug resistance-associated protein lethal(2)03659 [Eumeta japonica]|uniref:Probable multidrug resistance-associated protein lethal(2)03659 n=1 Tax=Eumeta variegata TaxID=151549 RepID=A0A4C1XLR6_EUMVA|nr:Probable multidrug resistance-associated protein lethal(2)03659 [Eumeta japonica]
MIKGFSTALTVFTERFILFAAIVTFVAAGGFIRAEIAFSLVQYFNLMQLACNIFFPLGLAFLAEAKVSVRRLEEFLALDEIAVAKEWEVKYGSKNESTAIITNGTDQKKILKSEEAERPRPTGLVLCGLSATWLRDAIVDTLRGITFTVRPGEFVGVAGPVGAGKSSLLQVILGELPVSRGSMSLGGARVAYASQEPWLFVGTVRQNILFGLPYDKQRYKKVIHACALVRDFEQLSSGDATLVGERGVSLSGGQRARIGLARAVYREPDSATRRTLRRVYHTIRVVAATRGCLDLLATLIDLSLLNSSVNSVTHSKWVVMIIYNAHVKRHVYKTKRCSQERVIIMECIEADVFEKRKIGVARTADIYLLDDPLSAVDTHVGKHIMSECVLGFLRGTTRLLVTHQLHHLKASDSVIILRNGEVEIQGSFDDVSRTPLFSELLQEEEQPETSPAAQFQRTRTLSVQSHTSMSTIHDGQKSNEAEEDPQETDELMAKGRVSGSVYLKYFRAGGGFCILFSTILSIVIAQVVTSIGDLWLTYWMNGVENNIKNSQNTTIQALRDDINSTLSNITSELLNEIANATATESDLAATGTTDNTLLDYQNIIDQGQFDHSLYIYVWAVFIVGCIILTTWRSMLFLWVCMRSSIRLHNTMFGNVLHATMRFFDTNPSGRILNRFSKDMGIIDEVLPRMFLDSIQIFMVMLGILVMVAIVNPYMLLTTVVCGVLMYLWTVVYLSTAQAIKRIEGVTRSPVFSHVSASMAGLSTIRACNAQSMLRQHFDEKQDVHTAAWYLTLVTNTAFSIWLSLISAAYVLVVAYSFLLSDDGTTKSGNVGLAISQGLILVNMVQYGIKQATEVIAQMTSVERIMQFTELPQESPLESPPGGAPPSSWPARARVVIKDLYLRYEEGSEPVLKNLNIVVESGWKVGVVGRTGAGKSSLISALFRLAPIDGEILIDDIETGKIGLKDLRPKISIIPQEPVLFSASLRYNLDPFDKYTDSDIWKALEQVELRGAVSALSASVATGGSNFSAGQRQLLCLARAALARNRLLILDEATANVDPNTDALIQKSIRKHFADCTVITVAHRLHTVADSDRVIVMEAGQIVECGHPHELLQKPQGIFSNMVNQLGPAAEQSLRELAREAYDKHIQYVDADTGNEANNYVVH